MLIILASCSMEGYSTPTEEVEVTMLGTVKFLGPIPPPAKLPTKWRCAKDKYGRPYYYHIVIRKSQWEPPPLDYDEEEECTYPKPNYSLWLNKLSIYHSFRGVDVDVGIE